LCDEGETCLDIGANIGYMSSIMARRVGRSGRVIAFEPNPAIHRELEINLAMWKNAVPAIMLDGRAVALSDHQGSLDLEVPEESAHNCGLARVLHRSVAPRPQFRSVAVTCDTLDHVLCAGEQVGVAKLDVEGHEEAVLLGARKLLSAGRIRDWVFEHHSTYPSPVTNLFEENGYTVLRLKKGFFRPSLVPAAATMPASMWEPPSFVATQVPNRLAERFKPAGWRALRGR